MAWGAPPAGQGRDTPTELEKVTRCSEAFTKYSRVETTSSLLTVEMRERGIHLIQVLKECPCLNTMSKLIQSLNVG